MLADLVHSSHTVQVLMLRCGLCMRGTFNLPRLATFVINMIFIMTMIWKETPRLCVAVLPALFCFCTPQLASAAPSLPTHFVFAVIRLSHIGSPPLPEIPTSLPHSHSAMLFLFFVFGALISPTSSVATFNAAVFSPPARYALHDNHGRCIANSSSVSLTPP